MAISRQQKEQDADNLRDALAGVPNAILVDFQGLDVAGATDLRRKLRDDDARFRVVKNTVALRAIEDSPLGTLTEAFVGQTAIAFTDGDIVRLAKTLRDFAKEYETPSFKAGIVDGAPITVEEFEQLAEMPSRDELIGKALYLMNYPISGLATALGGILRSAVTVLDQIRQKREEAGDTGEAPVAAAGDETATEEAVAEAPAEEAAGEEAPAEEAAADEAPAEEAAAEDTPTAEAAADEATEGTANESSDEEAPADEPADAATASDEEARGDEEE